MKKRTRVGPGYTAFFNKTNGHIIRMEEDDLSYSHTPELYDIEITNKCMNNCPYCYMDSQEDGTKNMSLESIKKLFGKDLESLNDLPFQVALGGGEPTSHPEFIEILKYFNDIEVIPNYTTSGVGINPNILKNTEKYCGGIALTYHPHLGEKVFKEALLMMQENLNKVKVNVHLVVTNESIDLIDRIMKKFGGLFDKLVLINFKPLGRGEGYTEKLFTKESEKELLDMVKRYIETGRLAFDAGLFPFFISYYKDLGLTYKQIQSNFENIEAKYNAFIDVDLKLKPSSFYSGEGVDLTEENIIDVWQNHKIFTDVRTHQVSPEGSCKGCEVFTLCKGGIFDPGMPELDKVNFCKNKNMEDVNDNFEIG